MPGNRTSIPSRDRRRLRTTSWNLIRAAQDSVNPDSTSALAELCQMYWQPIYSYIRALGNDEESALDLTQGFFEQLLEKKLFKVANRERGRFRSFLFACVKHYVSNERNRARAQKRGGGNSPIRLDLENQRSRAKLEPVDDRTPENIFERRWAHTLINRALAHLEESMLTSAHPERYVALKSFLSGGQPEVSYKQVAQSLNMTETAVKVAVHRLRHRYGLALRDEVAKTVTDPSEIDSELRYLLKAVST